MKLDGCCPECDTQTLNGFFSFLSSKSRANKKVDAARKELVKQQAAATAALIKSQNEGAATIEIEKRNKIAATKKKALIAGAVGIGALMFIMRRKKNAT
jgi:hypothetical protein